MTEPTEISQEELEELERNPAPPPKKEKKRPAGQPRDELGRFTKLKAKKGKA